MLCKSLDLHLLLRMAIIRGVLRRKGLSLAAVALVASAALVLPGTLSRAGADSPFGGSLQVAPHATDSKTETFGTTTSAGGAIGSGGELAKRGAKSDARKLRLVTTTALLADLVKQVAGDRAQVTPLVPASADPHSYEPSLRDVRNIVYADAAFSNYLMLEEHALIRAIDANLSPRAVNVSLAEESAANGVRLIPLVEDVSLNTVWLGLRVRSGEVDDMRQGTVLGEAGSAWRKASVAVRATCLEYQSLEDTAGAVRGKGSRGATLAGGKAAGGGHIEASIHAYLTGTFGNPTQYWSLKAKSGRNQCGNKKNGKAVSLPVGAHTHLSWAFSHPGVYRLHLEASAKGDSLEHQEKSAVRERENGGGQVAARESEESNRGVLTFLVGSSPEQILGLAGKTAVNRGHVDLSARLNQGQLALELYGDAQETPDDLEPKPDQFKGEGASREMAPHEPTANPGGEKQRDRDGAASHDSDPGNQSNQSNQDDKPGESGYKTQRAYSLADSVVVVPNQALTQIPASPEFRFLGRPGTEVYQLAQAVLGKHIHGTLDPHTWHDVGNAQAYLRTITDTLAQLDPVNAQYFQENRDRAVARLERLDAWMREVIASIPASQRYLVTTHDAYGYLGAAYGVKIAGFVSPNPGVPPSTKDLVALNRTLDSLRVKAVFLEPNLASYAATLRELAGQRGIAVCRIYGDTFDQTVKTYVDMMQANTLALKECLDPGTPLPAVPFDPKEGK